jgi:hypothetical protein
VRGVDVRVAETVEISSPETHKKTKKKKKTMQSSDILCGTTHDYLRHRRLPVSSPGEIIKKRNHRRPTKRIGPRYGQKKRWMLHTTQSRNTQKGTNGNQQQQQPKKLSKKMAIKRANKLRLDMKMTMGVVRAMGIPSPNLYSS